MSSPQRRLTSVLDLEEPGGHYFVWLKVSGYKPGLLLLELFSSLIGKDIDQKHYWQSPTSQLNFPILTLQAPNDNWILGLINLLFTHRRTTAIQFFERLQLTGLYSENPAKL